jgi:hypothetical protein
MLEILEYATSGFWRFIGCFILLALAGQVTLGLGSQLVRLIGVMIHKPDRGAS